MTTWYRTAKHKYNAKPTTVDGIRFASRAEARRYNGLTRLVESGEITRLELQPRYKITINARLICTYVADFRYFDNRTKEHVVEDVKGMLTPVYKLKKKMVEAQYYPLKITEVK